MSLPCGNSYDCDPFVTNRLCYGTASSSTGECLCNAHYAWTGPNCRMFSTASKIQLVWMAFIACFSILVMVAFNYVLVKLWSSSELTFEFFSTAIEGLSNGDKIRDDRVSCAILFLLYSFAVLCWALARTLSVAEVEGVPRQLPSGNGTSLGSDSEYAFFSRFAGFQNDFAVPLVLTVGVLAVSNLGLLLSTAVQVRRKQSAVIDDVAAHRNRVRMFQVLCVGLLIVALVLDGQLEDVNSLSLFVVFVVYGYMLVRYYTSTNHYLTLLAQAHKPTKEEDLLCLQIHYNVAVTRTLMAIGLVLIVTSSLFFGIADDFVGIDTYFSKNEALLTFPAFAELAHITGAFITCFAGLHALFTMMHPRTSCLNSNSKSLDAENGEREAKKFAFALDRARSRASGRIVGKLRGRPDA